MSVTVRDGDRIGVVVRGAGRVNVTVGVSGDVSAVVDAAITQHRLAPTPHPAYDDIPDLTTLFRNGLA